MCPPSPSRKPRRASGAQSHSQHSLPYRLYRTVEVNLQTYWELGITAILSLPLSVRFPRHVDDCATEAHGTPRAVSMVSNVSTQSHSVLVEWKLRKGRLTSLGLFVSGRCYNLHRLHYLGLLSRNTLLLASQCSGRGHPKVFAS